MALHWTANSLSSTQGLYFLIVHSLVRCFYCFDPAGPPASIGLTRVGLMLASRGVNKVHAATFASVHDEGKQLPDAYALLTEDHRRATQVGN